MYLLAPRDPNLPEIERQRRLWEEQEAEERKRDEAIERSYQQYLASDPCVEAELDTYEPGVMTWQEEERERDYESYEREREGL